MREALIITLDNYAREATLSPPCVVPLDVEGAELLSFMRMVDTLRGYRIGNLCEVHVMNKKSAQIVAPFRNYQDSLINARNSKPYQTLGVRTALGSIKEIDQKPISIISLKGVWKRVSLIEK